MACDFRGHDGERPPRLRAIPNLRYFRHVAVFDQFQEGLDRHVLDCRGQMLPRFSVPREWRMAFYGGDYEYRQQSNLTSRQPGIDLRDEAGDDAAVGSYMSST